MPSPVLAGLAAQGRVLATLDDWRAITFVLVMVMVVLVGIIIALLRASVREHHEMTEEREQMWAVAERFGNAANKLTIVIQSQRALLVRVEEALNRLQKAG